MKSFALDVELANLFVPKFSKLKTENQKLLPMIVAIATARKLLIAVRWLQFQWNNAFRKNKNTNPTSRYIKTYSGESYTGFVCILNGGIKNFRFLVIKKYGNNKR